MKISLKLYQDNGNNYKCNVEIITALTIDEVNEYYKKVLLINIKNITKNAILYYLLRLYLLTLVTCSPP